MRSAILKEAPMQKRWVRIAIAAAAVLVLVLVLIPLFINADTFRPTVENRLSQSLGRRVTLGRLGFSLFGGSLDARDVAIADDPAFNASPFLTAQSLRIGVEVGPLLFHRQVNITRLIVDSPSIHLIHGQNGRWNFSSLGGASSSPSTPSSGQIPDLTVAKLTITNGSATVSSLPAVGNPLVYSGVDLSVQNLSFRSSFPFQLSAKLPGSGSLSLSGNAGPLNQQNAADTPFNATLGLKHFDPVAAGVVPPGEGISMNVDLDAQLASDGHTLTSNGKIQADHLQLARTGSPAPHPVLIDYSVSGDLGTETGQVNDLAVHTGSVAVHITGNVHLMPQAAVLNLHLAAPNLPIDQLEQFLPVVGVTLPTGSQLRGGTLTANLAVTGPATASTIAGPVEIDNSTLAGFDLGSQIAGLKLLGKSVGGTQIQLLRATLNASPQITQITNIDANLPQLGTATGSGTVAPSGAIDFKLVATLSSSNAAGAAANQAINAAGSLIGGFLHRSQTPATTTANRGIPLTITGTTQKPSIHANVMSMLK
jgi:AsmA protein